jgi:hypothetical protein
LTNKENRIKEFKVVSPLLQEIYGEKGEKIFYDTLQLSDFPCRTFLRQILSQIKEFYC